MTLIRVTERHKETQRIATTIGLDPNTPDDIIIGYVNAATTWLTNLAKWPTYRGNP